MPITKVFQQCSGGCGKERERTGEDAKRCVLYNIKWWCEICMQREDAEYAMKPILDALEKCPHLRAKLRDILGMK